MTARYRLPDILGGGEIEAEETWGGCAGGRPEYDLGDGITILAPAGQPLERVVVLPPEPPENTVVRAGPHALERIDDDMAPSRWYGLGESTPHTWEEVCAFGTPVLLVPAPEPVTLPWTSNGVEVDQTISDDGPGSHVHVSTEKASYGFAHLKPDVAREMARAIWTAADVAEATP